MAEPRARNVAVITRTGDDGTTALLRAQRVPKTDSRIEAIGTIDELSALLACAAARSGDPVLSGLLHEFQQALVSVMAELAVPEGEIPFPREALDPSKLRRLDRLGNELQAEGTAFQNWVLHDLSDGSATLDLARAVCRRAERRVWAVDGSFVSTRPFVPRYMNRLADILWLLARRNPAAGSLEELLQRA